MRRRQCGNERKDTYISYENAVCALDNAFFHQPNKAIFYAEQTGKNDLDSDKITKEFYNLLTEEKYAEAKTLAENLYKHLYKKQHYDELGGKKSFTTTFPR
ncbi:MAG: hypothetical protein L6V93_20025 [Clostridiales bacterium]|nr:MAG: hypothetical protein L6V93_20025 [Clostridiales bacterium]